MGHVNQLIEDASATVRPPIRLRQRVRRNFEVRIRESDPITVLANLPEVPALWFGHRGHGPVVGHEQIDPAQSCEQMPKAAGG